MKYDFNIVKQAFMNIQTFDEWERLKNEYPEMHFSDMDLDMKNHMNKILKGLATSEQLESPQVHFEVKKRK